MQTNVSRTYKVSNEQLLLEMAVSQHERLTALLSTIKNEVTQALTQDRITALEKRYPMLKGNKLK